LPKVLTPKGIEIEIPEWARVQLQRLGLWVWNPQRRRYQISARYFSMLELIRAKSPATMAAAKTPSPLCALLGPDCDGPNTTELQLTTHDDRRTAGIPPDCTL